MVADSRWLPGNAGGVLGDLTSVGLQATAGFFGAGLFLIGLLLIGLNLCTGISWLAIVDAIGRLTVMTVTVASRVLVQLASVLLKFRDTLRARIPARTEKVIDAVVQVERSPVVFGQEPRLATTSVAHQPTATALAAAPGAALKTRPTSTTPDSSPALFLSLARQ